MNCYVNIREDNQKVRKINRVVNQAPILSQNVIKFKDDGPQMSHWRAC